MNKLLFFFIFLIALGASVNAQETQTPPKDKKKIELRPNSREYRPIRRDNLKQRIVIKKDKALLLKRRAELQRIKMMQMQKNRALKQEQMNRKRQIMQQRRATRK